MYYEQLGLSKPPFRLTPDTHSFYGGAQRAEILQALIYAVVQGEGILCVSGEVGSGKSMLCRMLETALPSGTDIVYIANPNMGPADVLLTISTELGIGIPAKNNRYVVMQSLQKHLLERHVQGRHIVLLIEEAQAMPVATLKEICLLSNLETQESKLLQIVLFGQPELLQHLAHEPLRPLRERITHSFYLPALDRHQTRDYLMFRLRRAGYNGTDPFAARAIWLLAHYARGLVRRINILADKALLAAYAHGHHQVMARDVWLAARDCRHFMIPGGKQTISVQREEAPNEQHFLDGYWVQEKNASATKVISDALSVSTLATPNELLSTGDTAIPAIALTDWLEQLLSPLVKDAKNDVQASHV